MVGVLTAGLPGVEQAGQAETGVTAGATAGAAADLALDNQRAQGTFGEVVVRRHLGMKHELEQLVDVAQQPLSHGLTGVSLDRSILKAKQMGALPKAVVLPLAFSRVATGGGFLGQPVLEFDGL